MAAYLQQGHGSWGLLEEPAVGTYDGIVLSPVNDGPDSVRAGLARLGEQRSRYEVILDPQLYNPAIDKGKLNEWSYYPADFATANHADVSWWSDRGRDIVSQAAELGVNAICSPAMFPRHFTDDYYRFTVEVADSTAQHATDHGIDTLLTAIVPLKDLSNPGRAMQIASILSSSDCERIYLTFLAEDVQPREPLCDGQGLPTAVHLVRLLSRQMRVHVAFCSHDLVLWKLAGAADVSSGKYFNLRRFTPGRWQDDESSGRVVSYWNEGKLGTLLRDQDVLRLDREGWFEGRVFTSNPSGAEILEILRSGSGKPWQKLSWQQYLRWVHNAEERFSADGEAVAAIERWDRNWTQIDRMRVKFTDRFNDGSHIRIWLNAAIEGLGR
jgi:hypothetical protein